MPCDLSGRLAEKREYAGCALTSTQLSSSVRYTYSSATGQVTAAEYTSPSGTVSMGYTYGNGNDGQMQDVIPVGADGKALGNAILYSDGRADEQARTIIREAAKRNVVPLGDAYIAEITGNHFDGSMPLTKILWLKENEPEI